MDCSPWGSSVHGLFQARMLEWVAIPSPEDLPDPGIEPTPSDAPALQAGSLPHNHQVSPFGLLGFLSHIRTMGPWGRKESDLTQRLNCRTMGITSKLPPSNSLITTSLWAIAPRSATQGTFGCSVVSPNLRSGKETFFMPIPDSCYLFLGCCPGFPCCSLVENLPANVGDTRDMDWSLSQEDSLE